MTGLLLTNVFTVTNIASESIIFTPVITQNQTTTTSNRATPEVTQINSLHSNKPQTTTTALKATHYKMPANRITATVLDTGEGAENSRLQILNILIFINLPQSKKYRVNIVSFSGSYYISTALSHRTGAEK